MKKLKKNTSKIFFLSPHLDDVALSCGELITQLSNNHVVTIVNIFTKAHKGPYTLSAKKFLKDAKFSDAEKFYDKRKKEDKNIFNNKNIEIVDLEYQDALFRKKEAKLNPLFKIIPEMHHFYPTYRWHINKGISITDTAPAKLVENLKQFISPIDIVFAPYCFADHVDHHITKNAANLVSKNIIYYADFPYNYRQGFISKKLNSLYKHELEVDLKKKEKMLKKYKTQFSNLFPSNQLPEHREIYYSKSSRTKVPIKTHN